MDRTQLSRFPGHDKKPQWLAEADDWKITTHIVNMRQTSVATQI